MKFSYKEKGNGEIIILIHSYLWDSEMWKEQFNLLSERYQCIAIDMPGHGKENPLSCQVKCNRIYIRIKFQKLF